MQLTPLHFKQKCKRTCYSILSSMMLFIFFCIFQAVQAGMSNPDFSRLIRESGRGALSLWSVGLRLFEIVQFRGSWSAAAGSKITNGFTGWCTGCHEARLILFCSWGLVWCFGGGLVAKQVHFKIWPHLDGCLKLFFSGSLSLYLSISLLLAASHPSLALCGCISCRILVSFSKFLSCSWVGESSTRNVFHFVLWADRCADSEWSQYPSFLYSAQEAFLSFRFLILETISVLCRTTGKGVSKSRNPKRPRNESHQMSSISCFAELVVGHILGVCCKTVFENMSGQTSTQCSTPKVFGHWWVHHDLVLLNDLSVQMLLPSGQTLTWFHSHPRTDLLENFSRTSGWWTFVWHVEAYLKWLSSCWCRSGWHFERSRGSSGAFQVVFDATIWEALTAVFTLAVGEPQLVHIGCQFRPGDAHGVFELDNFITRGNVL